MTLTRRRFLTKVAAVGGAPLVYEAMTGLGLLAAPAQQTHFELPGRVSNVRVLVLGAGIAGLTLAYELGKAGYDCRVLEARARPGGRAFTVRRGTVSDEDGPAHQALGALREPDGRVYFAGDYMAEISSFMQGAFESAREVAVAVHRRALNTPALRR